jgi:peptidoglycan/LPS O-acetylase OafA/YrhL
MLRKSGWPDAIYGILMGVAIGIVLFLVSYVDQRIAGHNAAVRKFSARIGLYALFVAVALYTSSANRATPAPWLLALIVLFFVALISILDDRHSDRSISS